MKIKHVKAKSFLSIGNTPIEIDFSKLGNIINIKGHNYDRKTGSSNGAGKSSIAEMIVFSLYGKLLKKMSHKEAMNNKLKKGLEVEIAFEKDNKNYRILRKKATKDKSMAVQLWIDDEEWTQGSSTAETQKEIEKAIGLSFEAFTNISFFGQHNIHQFLSCDAATKRQIVENLLALEKYNQYCLSAKDKKKTIEAEIKSGVQNYENTLKTVDNAKKRILQIQQQKEQWRLMRENDLEGLIAKLTAKEKEIINADNGQAILKYKQAKEELPKVREEIAKQQSLQEGISKKVEELQEKLDVKKALHYEIVEKDAAIQGKISVLKESYAQEKESVNALTSLKPGEKCSVCHEIVNKDNYHHLVDHHNDKMGKANEELIVKSSELGVITLEMTKSKEIILKIKEMLQQCALKTQQIKKALQTNEEKKTSLEGVQEPTIGLYETLLAEQRDNIKSLLIAKEKEIAGGDPYQEMYKESINERDTHQQSADVLKEEIRKQENRLPYYDYWIKGFGDKGIRSLIIDGIIPALNTRINYWLQFLIDNQIRLNFDSNLAETIESNPPDGDPFVYNGLSGGEHMRIDLAISQAFAYLMMLSSGTCPSIVALDEVVTYQDRPGVHCIYAMICELARDRQVLVITHDQDLLQMLEVCDTITVIRKDGFSTASVVNFS